MATFAELDEDAAGLAWALDREIVYYCVHCRRDIDVVHDEDGVGEFVHVDTGRRECAVERDRPWTQMRS